MRNVLGFTVIVAVAFALIGAAIAGASPAARSVAVTTASTGLGQVIADGRGRTLYLFEKDTSAYSACSGLCVVYWPPLLTRGTTGAIKGAKRLLLSSIRRSDGTRQVTYAGHPLYLFSGDVKRGQTNGEDLHDFGASWFALTSFWQEDRARLRTSRRRTVGAELSRTPRRSPPGARKSR